jgi:hypothetical protein
MTDFQYPPDVVSGSFTANGQTSASLPFLNQFSVMLGGTFNATVLLERSPDGGTTFYPCSTDGTGTQASYTAPMSVDVVSQRHAMLYRLRVTAYSSGTINYVFWQ